MTDYKKELIDLEARIEIAVSSFILEFIFLFVMIYSTGVIFYFNFIMFLIVFIVGLIRIAYALTPINKYS